MATELSAHELELLKTAVPYTQELGRLPTQEELRAKLSCRSVNAKNIQHFLVESEATKVAARLEALPIKAEAKAAVAYALGDQSGSLASHVLRENAKLQAKLGKKKHESAAFLEGVRNDVQEEIEALKVLAKSQIRDTQVRIVRSKELSGNLLEVNLPDAHFGKLSWPQSTGGAAYDSKIAQTVYTLAIDALIERTKHYKYDEVLYVVGNDYLNANNSESQTGKGTIVESDGRYQKTFWKARNTVIETIKKLLKIAPVKVMAVYGNHDPLSGWHLADSVECFFNGNKEVTVFNDPVYRKYYEFGQNMFLFTHGDKGRKDDYALVMAAEQPAMFGRTRFHETHCGHTHETKMQEQHGVRTRVLPALCPADSWHSDNFFIGNLRNAEAYIWNREQGLVGTAIYNVDSQPEIKTERKLV